MPKVCFCEATPQEPLAALNYNHWTQTSNPTTSATVEGYAPVIVYHDGFRWGGLALSDNAAASVMDGSIGSRQRYFAVGARTAFNGGLPVRHLRHRFGDRFLASLTALHAPPPHTHTPHTSHSCNILYLVPMLIEC